MPPNKEGKFSEFSCFDQNLQKEIHSNEFGKILWSFWTAFLEKIAQLTR